MQTTCVHVLSALFTHIIPCRSTRKTQLGLPYLALSSPCSCLPTPYLCQFVFMEVRAHKKSQLPEVARERGWKDKGAWKEGCSGGGGVVVTAKTTAAMRTNWTEVLGTKTTRPESSTRNCCKKAAHHCFMCLSCQAKSTSAHNMTGKTASNAHGVNLFLGERVGGGNINLSQRQSMLPHPVRPAAAHMVNRPPLRLYMTTPPDVAACSYERCLT